MVAARGAGGRQHLAELLDPFLEVGQLLIARVLGQRLQCFLGKLGRRRAEVTQAPGGPAANFRFGICQTGLDEGRHGLLRIGADLTQCGRRIHADPQDVVVLPGRATVAWDLSHLVGEKGLNEHRHRGPGVGTGITQGQASLETSVFIGILFHDPDQVPDSRLGERPGFAQRLGGRGAHVGIAVPQSLGESRNRRPGGRLGLRLEPSHHFLVCALLPFALAFLFPLALLGIVLLRHRELWPTAGPFPYLLRFFREVSSLSGVGLRRSLVGAPDLGQGSCRRQTHAGLRIFKGFDQGGHGVCRPFADGAQGLGGQRTYLGVRVFDRAHECRRGGLGTRADLPQRPGCPLPSRRILLRQRLHVARDSLRGQRTYITALRQHLLCLRESVFGSIRARVFQVQQATANGQYDDQHHQADRFR